MAGNTTGPRHQGREGFWMHGKFQEYLTLLEDDLRIMPYTVADEDVLGHRINCRCEPCKAPHVQRMKAERHQRARTQLLQRERGL